MGERCTVEGTVQHVIFQNEENGYTVLGLLTEEGELVTVVGCIPCVAPGEKLTADGLWVSHPSYGQQFAAETVERLMPETEEELISYLSSGIIKGVGPATAERLVERFGGETLAVIEEEPERLSTVKGITSKRAMEISAAFRELTGLRRVMEFLARYELPVELAMRLYRTYGADALRLFLLGSPVVRAEDLKFSEEGIKEVLRVVMLPIWNAYSFFTTYANVDNWEPPEGELKAPENPANPLDRWILSSLSDMVTEIREAMDSYHLQKAANRFEKFVEDLTNWYIRRSRRRFWKSQNDTDKLDAYSTLYYVLITFTKCAAPFIPYITEEIYRALRTDNMPESVHLCDYPDAVTIRDTRLEKQMESTMNAVSLGRFLRTQRNLKIRQPLAKAILVAADPDVRAMLTETADIISEELNVKQILVQDSDSSLVDLSAKANFKALGPKLGPKMKTAAAAIAKLTHAQIGDLEHGGSFDLELGDGTSIAITAADLSINRAEKPGVTVATEHGITLALDTELTHELILEGIAREFVSKVQNMRKEAGLEVSDRITLRYQAQDVIVQEAVTAFGDYISNETLATAIVSGEAASALKTSEEDLNGHMTKIALAK